MSEGRYATRLRRHRAGPARSGDQGPAGAPSWERDGRDWPLRETSRFVEAAGLRWHVQQHGTGPAVLLIHGTGAATHSWRGLAPLLARRFTVVAPDLPGHGFTQTPPRDGLSLPGMAHAVGELLAALEVTPSLAIGHSAGAAILIRMSLDGRLPVAAIVSLNGALLPWGGFAGRVFSPVAKLLAGTPLIPHLFARRASDPAAVERLLRDTGSGFDAETVELYGRLTRSPGHVAAAIGMMAHWDLKPLERDLPRLAPHLVLVAAGRDRMVPPSQALRVRQLLPTASLERLPGLGHLAHEERPERIDEIVTRLAHETGVAGRP